MWSFERLFEATSWVVHEDPVVLVVVLLSHLIRKLV